MLSQLGIEASRPVLYVVAFAIILGLVALFGLVLRKLTGGRLMMNGQDRARTRQPRLGVVDIYDLDRQRQLVLLRRDNVEHLLLIGGLNDVVIETNIVRVAGARIPAAAIEQAIDRVEPVVEAARPQVETPGRPSIETQLAAQLGSFMKRPSEETEGGQTPAPAANGGETRPELALRPDRTSYGAGPSIAGFRAETGPDAASRPSPEAPPVRAEPRYTPPLFQSRPTPQAPAAPSPEPPIFPVPPVRTTEKPAGERSGPDAVILSNMAKQLEEALKRPATPVVPEQDRSELASAAIEDNPDIDEDDLSEIDAPEDDVAEVGTPVILTEEIEDEVAAELPEPALDATAEPERERPEEPEDNASRPKPSLPDPFSVEEIEAEFARLLGRPLDTGKKG